MALNSNIVSFPEGVKTVIKLCMGREHLVAMVRQGTEINLFGLGNNQWG